MTSRSHHRWRLPCRAIVIGAMCALVALSGCARKDRAVAEIESTFEAGDYRETVALCKHAIRRNVDTPRVHYYYGAALVALNRDYEGFRRLSDAMQQDIGLSADAAAYVYEAALRDAAKGKRPKAARRFQKAVEFDPSLDIGPHRFLVADVYFEQGDYGAAAQQYEMALEARPDTVIAEQARFRIAVSWDELSSDVRAREAYEALLELHPKGEHKTEAKWRLANLLFDGAEKQFALGNYGEVLELAGEVMRHTSNQGLIQRTRFLLGETYEAVGNFSAAYEQYREVIREDRGASGRIVERARAKIAALKEAGL